MSFFTRILASAKFATVVLSTTTSVKSKPTEQKIEIIVKMSNIFQKLT